MNTRDAKGTDERELERLWQRFMAELHEGKSPTAGGSESWRRPLKLQVEKQQVIAAEVDHHILGFVGIIDHLDRACTPPAVAFLVDLYVVPEFRRKKIAQSLMRAFGAALW